MVNTSGLERSDFQRCFCGRSAREAERAAGAQGRAEGAKGAQGEGKYAVGQGPIFKKSLVGGNARRRGLIDISVNFNHYLCKKHLKFSLQTPRRLNHCFLDMLNPAVTRGVSETAK